MSKSVSITMNFGTAAVRKGGGEVSSVFDGIRKDARRTGQDVTKSLNVRTEQLVKNLGQVEKALRRIQDVAKTGRLAEIIKAADAVARAEVAAAQRASREKEKLAGEAIKRAQKVADAEAREAARMEREKVKSADRAADREVKAAQAAATDKTRIRVAEMQAASRIEAEKLKAVEAAERQKVALTERAERDRQQAAAKAASAAPQTQRADATGLNKGQAIGRGLQSAGGTMVAAGASLTATLTAPLAVFANFALEVGTKYDAAMAMFQVSTSATAEDMRKAAQVAVELGADMTLPATSAADAASAMVELGKASFTAQQAMDAARGVLQLAAAANISEAQAAQITASAIRSFNLEASDATRVADLLAASANASLAEITDVAQAMQQAGAVFKNANIPIEDLVTSIGLMAQAGIKGGDAGTSLKTMVQRLAAPTKQARAEINNLIGSVYDGNHKLKSYHQIISELSPALAKLTEEQRNAALQTIFGQDAMRAAIVIFGQGAEAYDTMREAVTKQGAAADVAAARTKGLGGAWEGLKSQVETFALQVYNQFKGPLETAVRSVAEFVGQLGERFSSFAQSNPEIVKLVGVFLALAAAVGPVLVVIGGLVMAVGGLIVSIFAIKAAVVAMGGVSVVLVTLGQALLALAAVAAVVAAAAALIYVAWRDNLGGIRDLAMDMFEALRSAFSAGLKFIQDLWDRHGADITAVATAVWGAVSSVVTTAITAIVTFVRENFQIIIDWFRENWPLIQQTIENGLKAIGAYMHAWFAAIQSFWRSHGEQIKAVVSAAWTIIKTVVQTSLHTMLDLIKVVMQLINGNWAGAWETYKGIVARVAGAVGTILSSLASLVWNILKGIVTTIINLAAEFLMAGQRIGNAIVDGIVNGVKAGAGKVRSAARWLANIATFGAMDALDVHSPSRVFFGIGRMVALGFALGISSGQAETDAAVKRLVIPNDIQTVTGKGSAKINHARKAADKVNRPGYDLLEGLYKDIDSLAPAGEKTKLLEVEAELAGEKYRGLANNIRDAITEAARFYDQRKANLTTGDALNSQLGDASKKLLEFKYSAKEGASEVEKFDLFIAQMRESTPQAAAALDKAAEKIKAVRDAWAQVDAAEKARKEKVAVEQLTKAVADMADESGVALRDVGVAADTHLEKLLEKLARLKGISLDLSQLNPVHDLAISIKDLPPEERLQKIAEALERIMRAAGSRPAGMGDADWKAFVDNAAKGIDNSAQLDEKQRIAKATDLYSKTLEDLNGQMVDNNRLTEAARVEQELLKSAYKDLNEEQKRALVERAKEVDQRKKEIEAVASQRARLEELADSITGVFDGALDDLFDKGFKGFFSSVVRGFKDMFKQIVKDFLLSGIHSIIRSLLGLTSGTAGGTTSGPSSGGGGILSTIGKLFGGLFKSGSGTASASSLTGGFAGGASAAAGLVTGGGFGTQGASKFASNFFGPSLSTSSAGATAAETLTKQVSNQTLSTTTKSGASSLGGLLANSGSIFKGIGFNSKPGTGGSLAAMLPMLGMSLGGGLVSGLAGPNAGGLASLMGMAGGALVGIGLSATPAIFAAGGSLASMGGAAGALFSNPFTAAAGAALLIGGLILGKQKQRRADEKQHDAGMVGSLQALNDLVKQVNTDKIMVADAVTQGKQIKQEYITAMSALKDKKTRQRALAPSEVKRLDTVISSIEAAGVGQKDRLSMMENRRPEFALGGIVPGALGRPVPMIGHGGEIFINPGQMAGVGAAVMALAGVPGVGGLPFATPTLTSAPSGGSSSGGGGGNIIVPDMYVSIDARGIFVKGGQSREGRRLIIGTVHDVEYEGEN